MMSTMEASRRARLSSQVASISAAIAAALASITVPKSTAAV